MMISGEAWRDGSGQDSALPLMIFSAGDWQSDDYTTARYRRALHPFNLTAAAVRNYDRDIKVKAPSGWGGFLVLPEEAYEEGELVLAFRHNYLDLDLRTEVRGEMTVMLFAATPHPIGEDQVARVTATFVGVGQMPPYETGGRPANEAEADAEALAEPAGPDLPSDEPVGDTSPDPSPPTDPVSPPAGAEPLSASVLALQEAHVALDTVRRDITEVIETAGKDLTDSDVVWLQIVRQAVADLLADIDEALATGVEPGTFSGALRSMGRMREGLEANSATVSIAAQLAIELAKMAEIF